MMMSAGPKGICRVRLAMSSLLGKLTSIAHFSCSPMQSLLSLAMFSQSEKPHPFELVRNIVMNVGHPLTFTGEDQYGDKTAKYMYVTGRHRPRRN